MTTDEQRDGWRAVAAGWERQRGWLWEATRHVSERLVEVLAPRPGDTVLELAAGSGDTGYLAAELIGPSGHLITSDFVAEIVDSARRRASQLGVENVEHRVLDAEALELPDESVDGVLCRWGYMLTTDPAVALRETRRVLRADRSTSFAVWGTADENPWASTPGRVLAGRGLVPPPEPDAPGPFRLGDRERVDSLLTEAGLEVSVHEDLRVTMDYDGFDEFWEASLDVSRALRSALEGLDEGEASDVRVEVEEALAPFREENGRLVFSGVTQIVLARRPT